MFKYESFYTEMTDLLQFTINVGKSRRQLQWNLWFVFEDRVMFIWVVLHVSLCGQQHPKCDIASNLSGVSTFLLQTSLFNQTDKQKSSAVMSGDSDSSLSVKYSELETRSYELFTHNDRYYHLQKYLQLLLNRPLFPHTFSLQKVQISVKVHNTLVSSSDKGKTKLMSSRMWCRAV